MSNWDGVRRITIKSRKCRSSVAFSSEDGRKPRHEKELRGSMSRKLRMKEGKRDTFSLLGQRRRCLGISPSSMPLTLFTFPYLATYFISVCLFDSACRALP